MPSLPLVVPGDLSVFYGQNTRISRESRLLNILNRRIFLQRNTYLSVKVALFPDGMLKLIGLSGEMADFPDESHICDDLSGKTNISPDDNGSGNTGADDGLPAPQIKLRELPQGARSAGFVPVMQKIKTTGILR